MKIKNLSRQGGFTLLEMVIVMGIIAVLAGGVIGLMGNFGEGAKIQRAETDMRTLKNALIQYDTLGGTFPSTEQGLEALMKKPTTAPIPKKWLDLKWKKLPVDPWKQPYVYERKGTEITLRSIGKDGVDGTDDDVILDE